MIEGYDKVNSIIKLKELGLPTPPTVFVNDLETQRNEVNNFLLDKEYVMIRSDRAGKSNYCPRLLKCNAREAKDFINKLNNDGYIAILQEHVPLNNRYSGNILVLEGSFIIESMRGGPGSKLTREGVLHEHLRISKEGMILHQHGESVIPKKDIEKLINNVKDLPVKHHIIAFSSGPDWFYFWDAQEDPSSKKLEQ